MRPVEILYFEAGRSTRHHEWTSPNKMARDRVGPGMRAPAPGRLITVGGLARRTGMSRKAIRELEGIGLIYSAGRSEANYRLFDERQALWCVNTVRDLRSLGLTLKEIQQLAAAHHAGSQEEIGPKLATLLTNAEQRIENQLADLHATQRRIADYRRKNASTLERVEVTGNGIRASARLPKSA